MGKQNQPSGKDAANTEKIYQILIKQNLKDLNAIAVGQAEVAPREKATSIAPNCSHLFFSCKGSGILILNGKRHLVAEQQFFVVPIGSTAQLYADTDKPWIHRWISFTGELSHDFMQFPTVFSLPPEVIDQLYDLEKPELNLGTRLISDLFLVHSQMYSPTHEDPDYVQYVLDLINVSYMNKLSVTQMAKELGLDRSHLSRVFKSKTGMSIQEYITHVRIAEAKRYMKHGYSVTQSALLCGFPDLANFSKAFRSETGYSPTAWKKAKLFDTYKRQLSKKITP